MLHPQRLQKLEHTFQPPLATNPLMVKTIPAKPLSTEITIAGIIPAKVSAGAIETDTGAHILPPSCSLIITYISFSQILSTLGL